MTNPQQFSTLITISQNFANRIISITIANCFEFPDNYPSFIQLTAPMSLSLVPLMPTHGECGAPQFNPTKPHELCHFFDDLRFQFT